MRYQILITDDDPCLIKLYRALFGTIDGLEVDYATSANGSRSRFSRKSYDLVLMDICLSDEELRGGILLLKEIKETCPASSVIMMSSNDDADTVKACLTSGADGFASKRPGFLPCLLRLVKTRLGPTADALKAG